MGFLEVSLNNLDFDLVDTSIELHFVHKQYDSYGSNFGEYPYF